MVADGDQLFGWINVSCFNCNKTRTYWVFFQIGHGGWYFETSDRERIEVPTQNATYTLIQKRWRWCSITRYVR